MQKVERQKHRDRKRRRLTGLLLCALLLAACAAAGLLLRKKAEEPPAPAYRPETGAVIQRSAEELRSLTVTQRGKKPWTAEREEDGSLRLRQEDGAAPDDWTVDEAIARTLIDVATNLTYEDVFTEKREDWEPEAAEFGLADPRITAVFRYGDGSEVTIRIGDSADPDGDAYYYLTVDGDDRLYAVASGTVQDLNTEKELLRPVRQPEIRGVLLDRITVKNGDGTVRTRWELQGKVSDRDAAENWLLTAPLAYPADYDAMQNLRDSAENLRLGIYIGKADEDTLKEYGLDKPEAIIELHMAAGSTGTVSASGVYDVEERKEATETLTIGRSRSEMTAYALYGGEIFTISYFSLSPFTQADPLATLARYTVATPLNSLESVTVEKQGEETVHYAIVRMDGVSGTGDTDASEEVRCLRNGQEIAYEAFSAAWERLLTVTVSGRLPEDRRPEEAHTRYTIRTVSGGRHTLELSDFDAMHDAVTMDGHTLFYLIKGGMTELP